MDIKQDYRMSCIRGVTDRGKLSESILGVNLHLVTYTASNAVIGVSPRINAENFTTIADLKHAMLKLFKKDDEHILQAVKQAFIRSFLSPQDMKKLEKGGSKQLEKELKELFICPHCGISCRMEELTPVTGEVSDEQE